MDWNNDFKGKFMGEKHRTPGWCSGDRIEIVQVQAPSKIGAEGDRFEDPRKEPSKMRRRFQEVTLGQINRETNRKMSVLTLK